MLRTNEPFRLGEHPIGVDLVEETPEELRASRSGELAAIRLGVERVGSDATYKRADRLCHEAAPIGPPRLPGVRLVAARTVPACRAAAAPLGAENHVPVIRMLRCAAMISQALSLGQLAGISDVEVQAFCSDCGQPLGSYFAGKPFPTGEGITLAEKESGPFSRTATPAAVQRPLVRGPRTQPGLYLESYGDQQYIRKRCTCPANEKRRVAQLGELPITIRADGVVVLLF